MLAVVIIILIFVVGMFVLVTSTLSKKRSVGGKQPPGVKPLRMGPSQPLPDATSGQRSAPNARPMVMGPARPVMARTYWPGGVHLLVEYGLDKLILRVDNGNLTITGPGSSSTVLRQGDSYHLTFTFQITET